MKKKFVPMTGLENLTESEKLEYYTNACEFFNVPVELNLLEFLWLDSGTGTKNLVLYAKRGATDIMRASHGIHVDEIKESINGDFVTFTAKGHDSAGRTDVAIGAAYIRGLTGRNLTNELMTGQTRATRRLTLQLVGGGLLDESEVQSTSVSSVAQPLQNIAVAPAVALNDAPGKDITEVVQKAEPESSEEPKKRRGRRRKGVVLDSEPTITEITGNGVSFGQKLIPNSSATGTDITLNTESYKNSFFIESDEDKEIREAEERIAILKAKKAAVAPVQDPKPEPKEEPIPVKPLIIKDLPKEDQMKAYKERLFVYTNDVLRKGGMKGSEGIGGVEYKVRAFVRLMFPNTQDTKLLTVNQWEAFFGYMDDKYKELGAEGLVKLIDAKLGVKE